MRVRKSGAFLCQNPHSAKNLDTAFHDSAQLKTTNIMHYVHRAVRSFFLGLIMFFSVKALGFSGGQASLAAAIPFILGIIDVMATTAFSMSGAVFIVAILAHVFPAEFQLLKSLATTVVDQAGAEIVASGTNSSPAASNPATSSPPAIPAPSIPANPPPVVPAPSAPANPPPAVPAPSVPANPPPVMSGSNPSTSSSPAQK